MARKKKDAGKQAMMNEAKALESKGKKQKAGVAPDEAPEMPMKMAKGMKMLESKKMGKEMPKGKHKKK